MTDDKSDQAKFNDDSAKSAADRAREALHYVEREEPQREAPKQEAPKQDGSQSSGAGYDPKDCTRVPGAIGRVVDWIERDAMYPSRRLGLVTALGAGATVMAQRVQGPTGAGTHLYLMALAGTGTGKSFVLKALKNLLSAIGAIQLVVGEFKSSVSLVETLLRLPTFLAVIDEFGDYLARLVNPNSGSYENDIMRVMKEIVTLSWDYYPTPSSKNNPSVLIYAPSPSLVGTSTVESFYGATRESQLPGGFLNRMVVIEEKQKTQQNPSHKINLEPPKELRAQFSPLFKPRSKLDELLKAPAEDIKMNVGVKFKPEIVVGWGLGAQAIFNELDQKTRNANKSDPLRDQLFMRVPENAIRLATIVAVGRGSRTVDAADIEWAHALALESAESMHAGFVKYSTDPLVFAGLVQRGKDMLRAAPDRCMTVRDFKRKIERHLKSKRDLDDLIKYLEEAEYIVQHTKAATRKGGRPSTVIELLAE
jgi:hypothetical protein